MKIRKVDDKPMVIHTKEKAKIHAHEPKGAKIKGSNIYTVERGPKTAGAKVTDTDRKKSYRKSTIHQSEPKNKGLSRFKQNLKESNTSIKTKNTNLHIAGRTGALVAGAVTDQVEGGQEVSQAAYLAYEASRPVTGTASKGAALFRKKAAAEAKKRIKKVEAGKKLAKKTAKKAAKDTAKTVAKETAQAADNQFHSFLFARLQVLRPACAFHSQHIADKRIKEERSRTHTHDVADQFLERDVPDPPVHDFRLRSFPVGVQGGGHVASDLRHVTFHQVRALLRDLKQQRQLPAVGAEEVEADLRRLPDKVGLEYVRHHYRLETLQDLLQIGIKNL